MANQTIETDPVDPVSIIREISLTKRDMREGAKTGSCHMCFVAIDRYLWIISKMAKVETSLSRRKKKEKLEQFLELCKNKSAKEQQLQGAVMEIPELAPQKDESSINVLSGLINHKNKYVQKNTCKALGLIGGEHAREILKGIKDVNPAIESVANEALDLCETVKLKADLELDRWTDEAVSTMVKIATQPYKRILRRIKAVLLLLVLELIIALILIWRAA